MIKKIVSLLLCAAVLVLAGCGTQRNTTTEGDPPADLVADTWLDMDDVMLASVDLDGLLADGLPLILYFGDDSQASIDTLDMLLSLHEELRPDALLRVVDLSLYPDAKEGFPVQTIPTQFFYDADGKPIPLPINIGVILSSFISVDTEEPIFTAHEGPLTRDEYTNILRIMGLVS